MAEYKRIAVIGSGIFGLAIAEKLQKLDFDVHVYEKNNSILSGASRNNLNRIHQGFHYPRSLKTIKQSSENYKVFVNKYKKFVKKKQLSFYFIAKKKSKVSLNKYLKVVSKIPYFSKVVSDKKIPIKIKNISGGILTNEKIYDWKLMEKYFTGKLNSNVKFFLKNYIERINLDKTLTIKKHNKTFKSKTYDFIIDSSYLYQNDFKKNLGIPIKKKIFQKTLILELEFYKCPDIGAAVMDGKFVSFLPKGNSKKIFLLYDVEHSVLKKEMSLLYPKKFNKKFSKQNLLAAEKKIIKKLNFFFPELRVKKINKYRIADRVLDIDNNDKRLTNVKFYKNVYFFVNQGKTDHCIEAAERIYKLIKKNVQ